MERKEQDNSITELKTRAWKSTKENITSKDYRLIRLCKLESIMVADRASGRSREITDLKWC